MGKKKKNEKSTNSMVELFYHQEGAFWIYRGRCKEHIICTNGVLALFTQMLTKLIHPNIADIFLQ